MIYTVVGSVAVGSVTFAHYHGFDRVGEFNFAGMCSQTFPLCTIAHLAYL